MLRTLIVWLVVAHDLTEYKHTGDVRTCFLCFVQDGGWFSEKVFEIILDQASEGLEKSWAGAVYMYETRKNQHKKVLGDLSLVEEIFTTVASCDTRSLENVCTIILVLWASEGLETRPARERLSTSKIKKKRKSRDET